jgi:hypothetical protein
VYDLLQNVLAFNASSSMLLTEEDKLQGRKQDIVVLVLRFLADYGYNSSYAALCAESCTSLQQVWLNTNRMMQCHSSRLLQATVGFLEIPRILLISCWHCAG